MKKSQFFSQSVLETKFEVIHALRNNNLVTDFSNYSFKFFSQTHANIFFGKKKKELLDQKKNRYIKTEIFLINLL